mmetsp:Transcript_10631/g.32546  ORF Transcript_10631/g.32546 Transcript_10631/m.32546 type:complete len:179 (+) Transcript_10631:82-618(+)
MSNLQRKQSKTILLGPPPKSGELSPHSQKGIVQSFLLIATIVIWGSQLDALLTSETAECNGLCIVNFVLAGICTFLLLFTLGNVWRFGFWKTGFTQVRKEILLMFILLLLSCAITGIMNESQTLPVTTTGLTFSWLLLFGSFYAMIKVYHAVKEEEAQYEYNRMLESFITDRASIRPS